MSSSTAMKVNICLLYCLRWVRYNDVLYLFVSFWYYYICVISRSSRTEVFLKIWQSLQEITCTRVSFLSATCNIFKKENSLQVFSFEFCQIFKKIPFYRPPPVAASVSQDAKHIGVNKFSAIFIHNILEYH